MNKMRKILLALCLAFCLALTLASGKMPAYAAGESIEVSQAREGVVRLFVVGEDGTASMGSAFGVGREGKDADTFITNWHVVTCGGTMDYHNVHVYILLDDDTYFEYQWRPLGAGEEIEEGGEYGSDSDGNIYKRVLTDFVQGSSVKCEVIYADKRYPDVAVLRTQEPVKNVKTMPLKKVSQGDIGRKVYAIGYPGSADGGSVTETDSVKTLKIKGSVKAVSVMGGVISRCDELESFGNTRSIVHDAHINHGNSGGPLVLEDGSVIGINTYGYGENSSEFSVSIYIDYAMEILDQLGLPYAIKGAKEKLIHTALAVFGCAAAAAVVWIVVRKRKSLSDRTDKSDKSDKSDASDAFDLYVEGVKGVFAGQNYSVQSQMCMGRNPQKCDLVYPSNTKGVSGVHCIVFRRGKGLTVKDMHSTYGTAVNGKKLLPDREYPLTEGDHLYLGSANEEFQIRKGKRHG